MIHQDTIWIIKIKWRCYADTLGLVRMSKHQPVTLICSSVVWCGLHVSGVQGTVLSTMDWIKISPNLQGLPRWHSDKESACQCRRHKRHGFKPWVRKLPWSRKWQFIPVFLPGKFHGQRSLAGYSPWSHNQSDTTDHTCTQQPLVILIKIWHLDWITL